MKTFKKKNRKKQKILKHKNCYKNNMLSLCIFAINSNSVLNLASGSGTTSSYASTPLPSSASALAQSSRFSSNSSRLNKLTNIHTYKHTCKKRRSSSSVKYRLCTIVIVLLVFLVVFHNQNKQIRKME